MTGSFWDTVELGPEGWAPKAAGDQVVGVLKEARIVKGQYQDYPLVVLATEAGDDVAVHGFHMSLARQLKELSPVEGELVGIRYDGQDERGHHQYHVGLPNRGEQLGGAQAGAQAPSGGATPAQPHPAPGGALGDSPDF